VLCWSVGTSVPSSMRGTRLSGAGALAHPVEHGTSSARALGPGLVPFENCWHWRLPVPW